MARVFLFNPQSSTSYGPSVSVTVNSAPPPYVLQNTRKNGANYVPFSRSGNRVSHQSPSGNDFGDTNSLAVSGNGQSLLYDLDIAAWNGDLIVYLWLSSIDVVDANGALLSTIQPSALAGAAAETRSAFAGSGLPGAASVTGTGSVYVLNASNEDTLVSLNGGDLATIAAWSGGSYTPSVAIAERVLNPSQGQGSFFKGDNAVVLASLSGPRTFTLPVRYPMEQDLILYLLRDHWLLIDQFGAQLNTGPYDRHLAPTDKPAAPAISAKGE